MADGDVPVSDVLCEAMEYLSKLGSNLRSRSETLKEKKIRKDKLKNAHAVQKAASKVLLICELSKKSLENVETGVKKILDIVEATQASTSDGGKTFTRVPNITASSVKPQYHYIEYQSKKLKIAKKISVKHFTSAKVKAKRMSISKHDKYPVYHDCKLYRIRHKKSSPQKNENTASSSASADNKKRISQQSSVEDSDSNNQNRGDKLRRISDYDRSTGGTKDEESRVDIDTQAKSENSLEKVQGKNGSQKEHQSLSHSSSEVEPNEFSHKKKKEFEMSSSEYRRKSDKKKMTIISSESDSESSKSSKKKEQLISKKHLDSENNKLHENVELDLVGNKDDDNYKSKIKEKRKDSCSSSQTDILGKKEKCTEEDKHSKKIEKFECNRKNIKDDEPCSQNITKTEDSCDSKESELDDVHNPSLKEKIPHSDIVEKSTNDKDSEKEENTKSNRSKNFKKKEHLKTSHESDSSEKSDEIKTAKKKVYRSHASEQSKSNDDHRAKEKHKNQEGKLRQATDDDDFQSHVLDSDNNENEKDLCSKEAIFLPEKKSPIRDHVSETEDAPHKVLEDSSKSSLKCKDIDNHKDEEEKESQKPLIKCVSLTKLLKSDILKKDDDVSQCFEKTINTGKEHHRNTAIKSSLKGEKPIKVSKRIRFQDEDEAEFWAEKREEVKAFKSKSFVINILRLPILSIDFLQQHNLSKVTRNGKIICKITKNEDRLTCDKKSEVSSTDVIKESESLKDKLVEPLAIDKVKNALLIDSDSEKSDSSFADDLANKTKNIVESLLNESDSDSNPPIQENNSKKLNSVTQNKHNAEENLDIKDSDGKLTNTPKINAEDQSSSANEKRLTSPARENRKSSPAGENRTSSPARDNKESSPGKENKESFQSKENVEASSANKNKASSPTRESRECSPDKENEESCPGKQKRKSSLSTENIESSPSKEIAPTKDLNEISSLKKDETSKKSQQSSVETETNKLSITEQNCEDFAKSSLLSDSSSDNPKKSMDIQKTRSKRKHIMESMHAKKMLLTYSSSSETEDEQLSNVIKEIKDSLLKGISSDEEIVGPKKTRKKLLTSSDSDEDLTTRVKRRKVMKSGSTMAKKNIKQEKGSESDEDASSGERVQSRSRKMGRSKEKASSSSGHSSDNRDDKDIDGLTNLKSLKKSQRRQGSDTVDDNSSTRSLKKNKMPKEPLIKGEGLLELPITSEEGSGAESEGGVEDLPPVNLSALNGTGIEHLAKDDLLGETDSESSNEKDQTEDSKKEDSETDENVKLKRRKPPAISSDSEAGSSRRKEQERGTRISDFEDSEEENSEPAKRSKRKKKNSDSDASGSSSNEGGKKKRRRIKQIDSDVSGSDTENEGRNKHGRKNIRKVMGKNQLEEATKKAAREEKERMARIAERQKMYNNLEFDESGKPDEVVLDKVVLDFDPETKEPLIEVDRGLVKKLKPHQANGIKFMWDACFESVKRIKKDRGSGCILAHCMGLGKTLQVVSLTHTLLTHNDLTGVNRVLVVCPLSTVLNWVNEFRMWLKHAERDYEVDVYELSKYKQNSERAFQLSQWFQHGGVCVLGYEMFRNLSADNPKKFKKKMLRNFQESLVDPGPDLVVCDEGHLLKNEKTSLSQSMNRVKTRRRIVLTGTPLQNNLKEYYCMVQFVKPNLLGKYNEYLNRFVNPITNGQYTDSTEHDIRVMKRRSHVLHKMLDGAVQRRDYGVLAPFLPPKHEYVLFITLTEVQIKLYQHYLENYSRRPLAGKSSGFLFPDFQSLQRIWTHPLVLKYNSERYEIMQQKKREREEEDSEGSLVDFIDDDSTPEESSTEESSDDLSDVSDDSRKKSKKNKAKKNKEKGRVTTRRGTRANPVELDDEDVKVPDIVEVKNDNPTEWWMPLVTDDELEDLRHSHKLVLLFEILRQCEAIGDKLLVFSQSLYSLDLIEHFLGKVDEATQEGRIDEKLGGHVGSWSPGIDYFRLDGSTSCENRSIWCKNFNREDNPRARLFLISTRAGGLGINLVAANRVVIFDVSWNPSHDVQSIFRVYRFGQKKPCYIYRFLAMGTMEEKIYERQVTKQAISKRVIDEQQIDRHYAENDLAELYKFEPQPPSPRPVPLVPKDRFFAEMLKEHEALIYKFHEHDSLLENKEEETLSEEERKAAWEDFENEKNKPPPAAFPSWPMHNGMVPNLLAQQQQQLAYAALATVLRKETPNLSDDQIRSMLPLIYGANPAMFGGYDYGLMQKLNDMYKYTQPGMMNPAMMNPVMNAGGATGGMGGGGTSGLQYEPPWQRQQQQQQQMRLQQLMQQQQSQMGAKYYAGGLGSRDPVAMALQQQRAREIMLGERARPRGRPPLQPRLPAAPGDVVNLDSD